MSSQQITVKALCLFRNGDSILVSDGYDSVKQESYCRPLGGSVEFGERAIDAVVREIREELGVEVHDVQLLGVLENLFTVDGEAGHQVMFVYDARFVDETLYTRTTLPFTEEGWASNEARWYNLTAPEATRLVPEGLRVLLG
ncbi:MAG: NUDIX domain-containing protein [bacterium]